MPKETLIIGTANTIIGSLGLVDKKPEPKKEEPKKPADAKKPATVTKPADKKAEVKPVEKKASFRRNAEGHHIWT
jgi:hypothetical protein